MIHWMLLQNRIHRIKVAFGNSFSGLRRLSYIYIRLVGLLIARWFMVGKFGSHAAARDALWRRLLANYERLM